MIIVFISHIACNICVNKFSPIVPLEKFAEKIAATLAENDVLTKHNQGILQHFDDFSTIMLCITQCHHFESTSAHMTSHYARFMLSSFFF